MKTVMKYSLLAAVAAAPLLAGAARADYSAYPDEGLPVGSQALNRDTQAEAMSPTALGLVLNEIQEREPEGAYRKSKNKEFGDVLNGRFRAAKNNNNLEEEFSYWVSGENGDSKCVLTLHVFSHEEPMMVSSLNDPGKNFVLSAKIDLRQFNRDGIRFPGNGLDNSAPWILNDQPISFIDDGHAVLDACAPREAARSTRRRAYFRIYREYFAQEGAYSAQEGESSAAHRPDFVFDGPSFQWELTHFVRELVQFTSEGGYFAQDGGYITRDGTHFGSVGGRPYLPFFGSFGGPYFGTGWGPYFASVTGPYFETIGGPYFPFSGSFGGPHAGSVGGIHAYFGAR